MKQGWAIKSLGEIADVEYGFTNKSTDEGDYRYVRITDIDDNGELISTEKKYLKHSKEAASFLLQDNDLLIARTGATFAKVLLYEDVEPSVFASYLIRIKFKEKIDNKLYWYFSKTKKYWDQANSLASGAAQPHFNGAAVKQVIFSYPKSLTEQQRIVTILDEAFAVIAKAKANAEQNLKNAKELFESYLQGVFENKGNGWEEKKLGVVCDIGDGNYSSKYPKASEFVKSGVPFLTATNLKNGTVIPDGIRYISKEQHLTLTKGHIIQGDLVIVVRGSSTGNNSIVPSTYAGSNLNSQLAFLRVKDKNYLDSNYLFAVFNSPMVMKKVKSEISGAAQPQLPNNKLLDISVNIPLLKEQHTIVRQLDALRAETQKLEEIYQKKIDDLEELKKSILQKAFAGELKTAKELSL